MIGYIEGKLLHKAQDRILVLANQIGYEILLPVFVMDAMKEKHDGDDVALFIFHQQTERQPKPMLIGFERLIEKEFFQHFISVGDIGPLKAVRAMSLPVHEMANAIEAKDVSQLKQLKGIGARTAEKMVAALSGKMGEFVLGEPTAAPVADVDDRIRKQVQVVLVDQLGYRAAEARKMMDDAVKRNGNISSPEELLEEVFRREGARE